MKSISVAALAAVLLSACGFSGYVADTSKGEMSVEDYISKTYHAPLPGDCDMIPIAWNSVERKLGQNFDKEKIIDGKKETVVEFENAGGIYTLQAGSDEYPVEVKNCPDAKKRLEGFRTMTPTQFEKAFSNHVRFANEHYTILTRQKSDEMAVFRQDGWWVAGNPDGMAAVAEMIVKNGAKYMCVDFSRNTIMNRNLQNSASDEEFMKVRYYDPKLDKVVDMSEHIAACEIIGNELKEHAPKPVPEQQIQQQQATPDMVEEDSSDNGDAQ